MSLSTYYLARKRVVVYLKEVLHMYPNAYMMKTALPDTICKAIGFKPLNNAEAVRFIISFSQSKVVDDVFRRRRKINRAKRAAKFGSLPAEEFYASLSWKKLRYQVLTLANGKCQCCGVLGVNAPLHVDHIKPRSKYPDLALDINNLQVLCADCNIGKLNKDETDWRKPAENDPEAKIKVVK